jgi:excisionase family DNA binding protein
MTRREVARMLGVSTTTVWRLHRGGSLPGIRIGSMTRYRREDVDVLINSGLPPGEQLTDDLEEHRMVEPLHDPQAAPLTRLPGPKRDKPPYRICFVSPCWHRGGLEAVTITHLRNLDRELWEPSILTGQVKDMQDSLPDDVPMLVDYDAFEWEYPPPGARFARARAAATAALREIQPDVVIGQLAHASLFAANDLGVPVIMEYHHCGWAWDAQEHPSDAIIAVTEHTAFRVHAEGRLPAVPVYLVYNGIDVGAFAYPDDQARADVRQYLGFEPTDKVIGFSGRFATEKHPVEWVSTFGNIKHGASAFRESMPEARGLMVGPLWEAEVYEASRERAEQRGLTWATLMPHDEVEEFTGRRPDAVDHREADIVHQHFPFTEMPRAYAAMDCLMHTRPDEPFGLIFPEALMCGTRVVGIGAAGPPEIYELLGHPPYMDLSAPANLDDLADTVAAHLNDPTGRVPPEYAAEVAGIFDSRQMTAHFSAIVMQYLDERETVSDRLRALAQEAREASE